MDNPNLFYSEHWGGRLPHIYVAGASFFITFCLYNSLPSEVAKRLEEERTLIKKEFCLRKSRIENFDIHEQIELKAEQRKMHAIFFDRYDKALEHYAKKEDILLNAEVAQIVADKMQDLDGKYYDLMAYCIMSNHVHLLIDTQHYDISQKKQTVSYFMQLLKGGTAFQINKVIERNGTVWQKESYDHIVREGEEERILQYILNNPVKANLVKHWKDWQFTYLKT
jgi:REP element-mobilizing transposase RayT